jgi:Domain of unknown function (DUF2341)
LNSTSNLSNVTIKLFLYHNNKLQVNCQDVYFTNALKNNLIFWIENIDANKNATIWIKLSLNNGSNTVIVNRHNPIIGSGSLSTVFGFYSDIKTLDYTTYQTDWVMEGWAGFYTGTTNTSGMQPGDSWQGLRTNSNKFSDTNHFVVEIKFAVSNNATTPTIKIIDQHTNQGYYLTYLPQAAMNTNNPPDNNGNIKQYPSGTLLVRGKDNFYVPYDWTETTASIVFDGYTISSYCNGVWMNTYTVLLKSNDRFLFFSRNVRILFLQNSFFRCEFKRGWGKMNLQKKGTIYSIQAIN